MARAAWVVVEEHHVLRKSGQMINWLYDSGNRRNNEEPSRNKETNFQLNIRI